MITKDSSKSLYSNMNQRVCDNCEWIYIHLYDIIVSCTRTDNSRIKNQKNNIKIDYIDVERDKQSSNNVTASRHNYNLNLLGVEGIGKNQKSRNHSRQTSSASSAKNIRIKRITSGREDLYNSQTLNDAQSPRSMVSQRSTERVRQNSYLKSGRKHDPLSDLRLQIGLKLIKKAQGTTKPHEVLRIAPTEMTEGSS